MRHWNQKLEMSSIRAAPRRIACCDMKIRTGQGLDGLKVRGWTLSEENRHRLRGLSAQTARQTLRDETTATYRRSVIGSPGQDRGLAIGKRLRSRGEVEYRRHDALSCAEGRESADEKNLG